jgi:hydroxymethylglutaryl-CoA synthase
MLRHQEGWCRPIRDISGSCRDRVQALRRQTQRHTCAEMLGLSRNTTSADFEFACKAGTEALQMVTALVEAGRIEYGLAIGADTAQGRPGDALEYTAASGAAAILVGRNSPNAVAKIEYAVSFVTDTPDFWRRSYERYPMHASRFTGEPAYFHHTISALKTLMQENGYRAEDIDYFVFHQPNVKFPLTVAKVLNIPLSKVNPWNCFGCFGQHICGLLDAWVG